MTLFDQILFILKDNAVLICTAVFFILAVSWGYRRGLMIKLLSLCSVVVTLLIVVRVYPMALEFINNNEAVNTFFSDIGTRLVMGAAGAVILKGNAEGSPLGALGTGGVTDTASGSESPVSTLSQLIEQARGAGMASGNAEGAADGGAGAMIPDSPLYDMLGLDRLADNAGALVGDMAGKVLCFIIVFIAVRIAVRILMAVARGLKRIRVIDWLDSLGGAVLGAAEGIIYIWIFMFIVSAFPGYGFMGFVLEQISGDALLTWIYNSNLILQLFVNMLI